MPSPDFEKLFKAEELSLTLAAAKLNSFPVDAAVDHHDLVQDAMERAYRFREGFKPESNFGAWMRGILRTVSIDNYRRTSHRAQTQPLEIVTQTDRGESLALHFEAERNGALPTVESLVEARARNEELWRHIGRLSPNYRNAILTVDILGLSYDEAATALKIKRVSVGPRIYKARRALARSLGPDFNKPS